MEVKYVEKYFIIELNKKIIDEWNARHPQLPEFVNVSEARLDEVLQIVEKMGNQLVTRDQIITKAAHLLGGLAWAQAFSGGNKRTAILSTTVFLRRNGLSITFPREEQRRRKDSAYFTPPERYEEIYNEAIHEEEERKKVFGDYQATPFEFSLYSQLYEENKNREESIKLTKEIFYQILPETKIVDWKNKTTSERKLKEIIYDNLTKNGFSEDKVMDNAEKIITLAKNRL